jgi:hypothetical protein
MMAKVSARNGTATGANSIVAAPSPCRIIAGLGIAVEERRRFLAYAPAVRALSA